MRPAKKRPIAAAFSAVFVGGSLVAALGAFLRWIMPVDDGGLPSLPLAALYLLAVIVYHSAVAGRVKFCSPGETMAGCRVGPEGKSWFTIASQARRFLWAVYHIALGRFRWSIAVFLLRGLAVIGAPAPLQGQPGPARIALGMDAL